MNHFQVPKPSPAVNQKAAQKPVVNGKGKAESSSDDSSDSDSDAGKNKKSTGPAQVTAYLHIFISLLA